MTPDQFRAALADLGLSHAGFARLAMVDARTVRRWCDGTRAVPGPVVALLRLLIAVWESGYAEGTVRQWARGALPVPDQIADWLVARADHAEETPPPKRKAYD
jgi:hypothetical protein